MMSPLMLPSAQLRGDRIARLNLVAAAAMLAAASLLLVLFQWFSLQASLQRNLQIQAGMLAVASMAAAASRFSLAIRSPRNCTKGSINGAIMTHSPAGPACRRPV